MKYTDSTSAYLPTRDTFYGLTSSAPEFLDKIGGLGTVYIQTRTDCGGLGKLCDLGAVYHDSNNQKLCDPTSGLMVDLAELVGIHSTKSDGAEEGMYAFDFEFESRPCGFSIYGLPTISNMEFYSEMLLSYFGDPLDKKDLDDWRENMAPIDHHCHRCEIAAEFRVEAPHLHPVYRIFETLIERNIIVCSRLLSSHSDLMTKISPGALRIDHGILSVSDANASVIALNMRYLHAMIIKGKSVDDTDFATIEIYNSLGTQGLEFLVEDPTLLGEWKEVCETSKQRNNNC